MSSRAVEGVARLAGLSARKAAELLAGACVRPDEGGAVKKGLGFDTVVIPGTHEDAAIDPTPAIRNRAGRPLCVGSAGNGHGAGSRPCPDPVARSGHRLGPATA
ncbi:hypothetical protein [Streptomyces sp. TE5632]